MPNISFDNTEIAFASKSDADLNRSYMLFTLVGRPSWVKIGRSITNIALGMHLPINGIIKATIFKQFCGGVNIEDCAKTIESLGKYNVGTILDYSVEGKDSETDLNNTANETIATIQRASHDKNIPFSVFKTTGLATFSILEKVSANKELSTKDKEEWERVVLRVHKVCKTAYDASVPIFIDAEETWIQPAIDSLANRMMEEFNKEKAIVHNTLQLYRNDRLAYLKISHDMAREKNYYLGVKLVRGAYMEKERERALQMNYPSPINATKADTDTHYNAALDYCVKHDIATCAGTHNEESSMHLVNLMSKNNIAKTNPKFYFSQLLGMSDHISYNLAQQGYNVAKYVPYGPVREVLPYLIRRAEENTSVKGQTGRELNLIIKEKQRRKKSY